MPSNIYTVGLRNAGSYLVSGQPYLSGSSTTATIGSNEDGRFAFPFVTKKIKITNEDTNVGRDLIVSFAPFLESQKGNFGYTSSASGSGNWLYVKQGQSIELDVKCKEIFIAAGTLGGETQYSIYAELTNIPTGSMYSLDSLAGVTYE